MSNGKWEIEGNIIEGAADGKWHHQVNVVADKSTWRCVSCQHMEEVGRCSRCENGPWFTGGYDNGELALICMSCRFPKEPWICPQCGTKNPVRYAFGKLKSGPCFIATAAYGSSFAPELLVFYRFRDEVLLTSKLGSWFVEFYYSIAPPIASLISKAETLKSATRFFLLAPMLQVAKFTLRSK